MTREQIEKAANIEMLSHYADEEYPCGIKDIQSDFIEAFSKGAQWRINSVWRDVSEVPEANKRVLVCFKDVIGEYVYYRIRAFKPNVLKNWNIDNFALDKVLYWAYLGDLLPERKEETE